MGGVMPQKYLSAIIVGNSYCAIFINIIQGIFLLTITDLYENAIIYYTIASLILILTGILNCKFHDLPFVMYYMVKANRKAESIYILRHSVNTIDSQSN
jgi:Nucleoside transporter